MPFKDPEEGRRNSARWRKKAIADGYGKALYARRAARYRNEEILREAVEEALRMLNKPTMDPERLRLYRDGAKQILESALQQAPPIGKPKEYMPHKVAKRKEQEARENQDRAEDKT